MADFLDIPSRMNEIWVWVVAFDAFDYGDPKPLSDLLEHTDSIPIEAARQLAKIVKGERKPNLKAAVKLKIEAGERMKIAGSLSTVIGLANAIRTRGIHEAAGETRKTIDVAADREGREVVQVVRELAQEPTKIIADAANQLNLSLIHI